MEDQSMCLTTTSISQNRVRLNEPKIPPDSLGDNNIHDEFYPCQKGIYEVYV